MTVKTSTLHAFHDGCQVNTPTNPQFTGLAYDGLVNFQQSPGADGPIIDWT